MNRIARVILFSVCGLCWFVAAVLLAAFAFVPVAGNIGLQFLSLVAAPIAVIPSLVHFFAFAAAAMLCFIIGLALWVHGMVPPARQQ